MVYVISFKKEIIENNYKLVMIKNAYDDGDREASFD